MNDQVFLFACIASPGYPLPQTQAMPDPASHRRASGTDRRPSGRRRPSWSRLLRAGMLVLGMACSGWAMNATAQPDDGTAGQEPLADGDAAESVNVDWGVGPWIWGPETYDKQTCRFWRAFDIPKGAKVTAAQLRISVDNGYRLMLDGRELGSGSDWRSITEYDITQLLKPGHHVVAVEGFNDNREAGMQFGLKITLDDGSLIELPSGPEWRIASAGERGWETRRQAPSHWPKAVEVSTLLPRPQFWYERRPTMIVRVPPLRPVVVQFWQSRWFQAALVIVLGLSVLVCLHLLARLALHSKAQKLLQRERARIARDIHDELGARLTELALEGEVIQTELPAESTVRPKLEALCEKARTVSGAMDEVVWVVNSRRDTLRDFATYACKHVQRFLGPTPIRCRLDVDPDFPEVVFELPVRRSLLLGVKEAVNNAVKYSGASELVLRIHCRGQTLHVVVEDNGAGFDLARVDPSRNGLTNMAERMTEIGGKCQVNTGAGTGCRVEFQVPLARHSNKFNPFGPGAATPEDAVRGMPANSLALTRRKPD
jgi:two-component sensor histidine kinase